VSTPEEHSQGRSLTSSQDRAQRLERLMQHALSELPLRRAPARLERRVAEAIEARAGHASRPVSSWPDGFGRKGIATWPLAVRVALLACCLASAVVVSLGMTAFGSFIVQLIRLIPTEWLVGGLLAATALYSMLFGLLAIGYSTLYATPERSRP